MVRDEPFGHNWNARNSGEGKGGKARNWYPTSLCRRLRISVLSNRHSQRTESYIGPTFALFSPLL